MKIAVIGGGSTYTPELFGGFLARAQAPAITEVALHDVDADRLAIVGGFCRRLVQQAGTPFAVTLAAARSAALDGADFVLAQIRVGGQEGRRRDILLGLRHGLVGQETTGVGGFAKALRTIPVMRDLAADAAARCPHAWLINFTNPSGIVTEALLAAGATRVLGLCNIPIDVEMQLARAFGVERADLELDSFGLNHLSWVRRVRVRGEDRTAEARALARGAGPANIPEMDYDSRFEAALGLIPSPYLRYYYEPERMVNEIRAGPNRAEVVMDLERRLLAQYADPTQHEVPALLAERGGAWYSRLAVEVIEALAGDTGARLVVNTKNGDCLRELPPDCVVEVPCRVDAAGARPEPQAPLPLSVRGLIQQVKAYESLTVEAALAGSYDRALLALVNHPHLRGVAQARAVLDDLLATHGLTLA